MAAPKQAEQTVMRKRTQPRHPPEQATAARRTNDDEEGDPVPSRSQPSDKQGWAIDDRKAERHGERLGRAAMTSPRGERDEGRDERRGEKRDAGRQASKLSEMIREMTDGAEPTSQASSEPGKLDDETRRDETRTAMR